MPGAPKRASFCLRDEHSSDSDDSDDEVDALDLQLEAEESAAANAHASKRRSWTAKNQQVEEFDMASDLMYELMEEEVMLSLLSELESACRDEFKSTAREAKARPQEHSPQPVATAAMFQRFSVQQRLSVH